MDTTNSEKLPIRFIDVQGTVYLRKEDVVQYLFDNSFKKPKPPELADIASNIYYYTGNGEVD